MSTDDDEARRTRQAQQLIDAYEEKDLDALARMLQFFREKYPEVFQDKIGALQHVITHAVEMLHESEKKKKGG